MYNKDWLKKGIYEKYSKVTKDDEFYNYQIGIKNSKKYILKKISNIAVVIVFSLLVGTFRICYISSYI